MRGKFRCFEKNEGEFACPISARLPVDPVTAKDGRIYDQHGLMTWFDKHLRTTIKSPVTGEQMSKEVVTAYQFRNTLDALVERGLLTGEAGCKVVDAYDAELKRRCLDVIFMNRCTLCQ